MLSTETNSRPRPHATLPLPLHRAQIPQPVIFAARFQPLYKSARLIRRGGIVHACKRYTVAERQCAVIARSNAILYRQRELAALCTSATRSSRNNFFCPATGAAAAAPPPACAPEEEALPPPAAPSAATARCAHLEELARLRRGLLLLRVCWACRRGGSRRTLAASSSPSPRSTPPSLRSSCSKSSPSNEQAPRKAQINLRQAKL